MTNNIKKAIFSLINRGKLVEKVLDLLSEEELEELAEEIGTEKLEDDREPDTDALFLKTEDNKFDEVKSNKLKEELDRLKDPLDYQPKPMHRDEIRARIDHINRYTQPPIVKPSKGPMSTDRARKVIQRRHVQRAEFSVNSYWPDQDDYRGLAHAFFPGSEGMVTTMCCSGVVGLGREVWIGDDENPYDYLRGHDMHQLTPDGSNDLFIKAEDDERKKVIEDFKQRRRKAGRNNKRNW